MVTDEVAVKEDDLKKLDLYFVESGFQIYKNRSDFNFMPEVDRLYSKDKTREKIFLKSKVFVGSKNSKDFLKFENGYLSNFKLGQKSFVLYFSGIELTQIKSFKLKLDQTMASYTAWSQLFIRPAYANYETCDNGLLPDSVNESGRNGVMWGTWGCIKGLGIGVWNSTLGSVVDVAKLGLAGAKSASILLYCAVPIKQTEIICQEWSDEIFASAEKNFAQISNMIKHFDQVISQTYPAFKEQDTDTKSKIICEVVSTMGVSTALSFVTFGGVAANSVLRIHQIMDKFNLAKVSASDKLASQIKDSANFAKIVTAQLSGLDKAASTKFESSHKAYTESLNRAITLQAKTEIYREEIGTYNLIEKAIQKGDEKFLQNVLLEDQVVYAALMKKPGRLKEGELRILEKEYLKAKKESDSFKSKYFEEFNSAEKIISDSKLSANEKKLLRAQFLPAKCSMMQSTISQSRSGQVQKSKPLSESIIKKSQ